MLKPFDGRVEIFLENNQNNETIINRIYHDGVSIVSPTIHLDIEKIPCYFLMHLGGGYVEGEQTSSHIRLKQNARSLITTQAPTIIYKCDNDIPTKQFSNIILERESVLEYLLDNTILFKNAVYEQHIDVSMDKTATFIYSDGITAGWSEDGKKYQYKKATIQLKITMDNTPILIDKLLLTPNQNDVTAIGFFEGYSNYGTSVIINPDIDDEFAAELKQHLKQYQLNVNYGISQLEVPGIVIRVLGDYTQDIQTIIHEAVNYTRNKFFGSLKLNLRKP